MIILGLTVLSCREEDEKVLIEIDKTEISLLNDETEVQLSVTSNTDWSSSLSGDRDGIQYIPTSGKPGITQVLVKAIPNAMNRNRKACLSITGGEVTATVQINQSPLTFRISPESLTFSADDYTKELTLATDVNWKITTRNWPEWVHVSPLSGKGNEIVQVTVISNEKRTDTSFSLSVEYAGQQVLIPVTFHGGKYKDGDYTVFRKSTKSNPIKLIITGDGYLPEHFKDGGLFDQDVEDAVEALFSMEPYKTYRDYFSVYKVIAFSKESGVSSNKDNIWKNTTFSCTLTGGTSIIADYEKIFSYALLPSEITESDLKNTSVCVLINEDTYAGTCYIQNDGKSIAMVPVCRSGKFYTVQFPNVLCHEYGGHGFGRLADEYWSPESPVSQKEKEQLLLWQKYNYFMNVSPYYTKEQVPWGGFIGLPDYPQVGIFEGGYYYSQGITRSEEISCMDDNRPYFNTQSRFLIMERILQVAGEGGLTYQKFFEKDVQKTPPSFERNFTVAKDYKPLGSPILVIKE